MQEAIDHLEKHKVFIDTLGTDMIPLSEAYKAIELSVNQQLVETMEALQSGLGQLGLDLQELQNEEEND
jgi:hypothetical protein